MFRSAPHRPRPRPRPRAAGLLAVAAIVCGLLGSLPASADAEPAAQTHTESVLQHDLLVRINAERHAHHLPALKLSADLNRSARTHTIAMDADRTMSHQLPHERTLGARITATGYRWRAVGENIGWTTAMTAKGVLALQAAMYGERPPNDEHREIILSTTYHQVGIGVVYDTKQHRVWITEDFGRAR